MLNDEYSPGIPFSYSKWVIFIRIIVACDIPKLYIGYSNSKNISVVHNTMVQITAMLYTIMIQYTNIKTFFFSQKIIH